MKILLRLTLLFSLLATAHAMPTGTWKANYNGVIGTVEFDSSTFVLAIVEGDSEPLGFIGPVVNATEPTDGQPGRAIIGPVENGRADYEVVWYYNPDGERARFYFTDQGFSSLEQAEAAKPEFTLEQSDPFMTEEFFSKVSALPAMPELTRDQFVALLADALQSKATSAHKDTDLQMDDLVIARGYDPVKSHESFDQALQAHGEDPEVKRLLEELAK